jgi:hypothetical protein
MAATSAAALAQSGGVFDLSWQTIGGGGGASAGGGFALAGTIGQPATERAAGGAYAVDGGYWPGNGQSGGVNPRTPTYLPLVVVD